MDGALHRAAGHSSMDECQRLTAATRRDTEDQVRHCTAYTLSVGRHSRREVGWSWISGGVMVGGVKGRSGRLSVGRWRLVEE